MYADARPTAKSVKILSCENYPLYGMMIHYSTNYQKVSKGLIRTRYISLGRNTRNGSFTWDTKGESHSVP